MLYLVAQEELKQLILGGLGCQCCEIGLGLIFGLNIIKPIRVFFSYLSIFSFFFFKKICERKISSNMAELESILYLSFLKHVIKTSESLIESLDQLYYNINILLNIKNKIK